MFLFFLFLPTTLSLVPEYHIRPTVNLSPLQFYELGIPLDKDGTAHVGPEELETLSQNNITYVPVISNKFNQRSARTTLGGYHNYKQLKAFINKLVNKHHKIAETFTIGRSVENRELIGVRMGSRRNTSAPQFKYVGNMHGDEAVGREILLKLIEYMLEEYTKGNPRITRILDSIDLFILPSMNPDGFEHKRRGNANARDLNRNFPDRFNRQIGTPEPETQAIMEWSKENHFVLSANMHGGSIVANYPFDGNKEGISRRYEKTVDDQMFRELALTYSREHPKMFYSREFHQGITNGAQWYVLYGGMQDWNYLETSDMEITVELSYRKFPAPHKLNGFWEDNRNSLISYIEILETNLLHGRVTRNGRGVPGIEIQVNEINHTITTNKQGYYWRLLPQGVFHIRVKGQLEWTKINKRVDKNERLDFEIK